MSRTKAEARHDRRMMVKAIKMRDFKYFRRLLKRRSNAPSQRPVHQGQDGQRIVCRPCGATGIEAAEVLLREDGPDTRGLEDGRIEKAPIQERDSEKALGLFIRSGREEAMIWRVKRS